MNSPYLLHVSCSLLKYAHILNNQNVKNLPVSEVVEKRGIACVRRNLHFISENNLFYSL